MVDAAGHPLGLGGLVVVIAFETARPGGVDQFADHSCRARFAGVGVDDLDSPRQWAQGARRGVECPRDRHPAFSRAEAVHDNAAEPAPETVDVTGYSLVAVHRPQRVVRVVGKLRCRKHIRKRLAHVVGVSGAITADVGQELRRRKFASQRH
ncbi:Uncharacterised protein [Mycobacterium tuberculosis]|nr:Uncharacterised protein [Mycobacterium tuberculosis]